MGDRLAQFEQWTRGGNRSVTIEINKPSNAKGIKIWVFDYDLMEGQHVNSVDEINLEAIKGERERQEYERLKAKFE